MYDIMHKKEDQKVLSFTPPSDMSWLPIKP